MSGPKILALSDPHFHAFKQHAHLVGGINSRFLDQVAAWSQALKIASDEGCRVIAIPGDLFDIRGSIKPSIYNPVTKLIQEAIDEDFEIVVIPGNHDMEHFENGESAVDSWDMISCNLETGSSCHVLKGAEFVEVAGLKIGGIPYKPDTEVFKAEFLKLAAGAPDVILIHQGIDDFNDGTYPATGLSEVWLLDNFKGWTLCGHYHNPKWRKGSRVINVGALLQHRVNDEGSICGCWTLTANGSEPDFHAVVSPQFVTLDTTCKDWSKARGAFVRIKAKGVKEADKLRDKARAAGAASVVVMIEREFVSSHETPVKIATPREMLSQYLDMNPKYAGRAKAILEMYDKVCRS